MAPKLVQLTGVAPSFESVNNLKNVLRRMPEFDEVEQNVNRQSGEVRFTLSITIVLK